MENSEDDDDDEEEMEDSDAEDMARITTKHYNDSDE